MLYTMNNVNNVGTFQHSYVETINETWLIRTSIQWCEMVTWSFWRRDRNIPCESGRYNNCRCKSFLHRHVINCHVFVEWNKWIPIFHEKWFQQPAALIHSMLRDDMKANMYLVSRTIQHVMFNSFGSTFGKFYAALYISSVMDELPPC